MVEHVHRPPLPRQDRPQARQLLSRMGKYEHLIIFLSIKCCDTRYVQLCKFMRQNEANEVIILIS